MHCYMFCGVFKADLKHIDETTCISDLPLWKSINEALMEYVKERDAAKPKTGAIGEELERQKDIVTKLADLLWKFTPHELKMFFAPEKASTGDKKNPKVSMVVASIKANES